MATAAAAPIFLLGSPNPGRWFFSYCRDVSRGFSSGLRLKQSHSWRWARMLMFLQLPLSPPLSSRLLWASSSRQACWLVLWPGRGEGPGDPGREARVRVTGSPGSELAEHSVRAVLQPELPGHGGGGGGDGGGGGGGGRGGGVGGGGFTGVGLRRSSERSQPCRLCCFRCVVRK